jgi:hemerythrin
VQLNSTKYRSPIDAPLIPFASWNDENCLGVVALDELHRDFFMDLNNLCSGPDETFAPRYAVFVDTVERIFRQEEQCMEEVDSSSLQQHQEQHARVLGALHNVQSRVMDGDICLGRDVAKRLLPQWMAFHMATMDTLLATEIQLFHGEIAPANGLKTKPDAAQVPS